jgi:Ankyrin repeats (3 copies)
MIPSYFVHREANDSPKNYRGLNEAISVGNLEEAKRLLQDRQYDFNNYASPLALAARRTNPAACSLLLAHHIPDPKYLNAVLGSAVAHKRWETAQVLVQSGANINEVHGDCISPGRTDNDLWSSDNPAETEELLKLGFNTPAGCGKLVSFAIQAVHPTTVDFLFQSRFEIQEAQTKSLYYTLRNDASGSSVPLVRKLLDHLKQPEKVVNAIGLALRMDQLHNRGSSNPFERDWVRVGSLLEEWGGSRAVAGTAATHL